MEFAIGFAIVALVLSDIFRTILLPRPTHRALRLAPIIGEVVVPAWLRVARRFSSPNTRQTIRGSLGPFLLLASLFIWLMALFLGFGLMMHATGEAVQPRADLVDSIYHAASNFLTLGMAPSTATGLAQVVTVASGMVGLSSVTVVATFLLSVQTELNDREVLVLRTEVAAGRPPTGLALLETIGRTGMTDELASLFRDWEHWAARVLHTHRANPILIQFRSADEDGEWLAVFGAVLDAASLLCATVESKGAEGGGAAARLFLAMGSRTARTLAELLYLEVVEDPADRPLDTVEFREVRRRLAAAGYAVTNDETAAAADFDEMARRYRRHIGTLCSHLGIEAAGKLDAPNRAFDEL